MTELPLPSQKAYLAAYMPNSALQMQNKHVQTRSFNTNRVCPIGLADVPLEHQGLHTHPHEHHQQDNEVVQRLVHNTTCWARGIVDASFTEVVDCPGAPSLRPQFPKETDFIVSSSNNSRATHIHSCTSSCMPCIRSQENSASLTFDSTISLSSFLLSRNSETSADH